MYWINIAHPPRIHIAWLNGGSSLVFVSDRMEEPVGLTIDYHMNNRLYWSDMKKGVIESINSDGQDRVVIMKGA